MKKLIFLVFTVALFAGCKKNKCNYSPCDIVAPATEIQSVKTYLSSQNITATQHCSGMFYTIDNPGSGSSVTACDNITFTYEGRLTNGTVFDKATSPVGFNVSELITGFKNGIPLIKTGGRIHLYIPPSLGYGSSQSGSIPANSILIFDVTLVGVQ